MTYDTDDIRDFPSYGVTEAARVVGMPKSTLRSWCTHGMNGEALFEPSTMGPPVTLSFNNLIEARILRILRVNHGIRLKAIREAIEIAQSEVGVERPLLHQGLLVNGKSLVLERYGDLIDLSPSTQLKMLHLLAEHMNRVTWDSERWAQRFYPTYSGDSDSPIVYIDPSISFGNSLVSTKCITTNVLHTRFNAGSSIEDLMEDYDLNREEVESAIVYEEEAA